MSTEKLSTPLMSATDDPFYLFKDTVSRDVSKTKIQLDKWKALLHATNTAESMEFRKADSELKQQLQAVEEALTMVKATVEQVSSARGNFRHIDDAELASRKAFVARSEKDVAGIRSELYSSTAKGKQEADERASLASRAAADRDVKAANRYDAAHAQTFQAQQQIRREQEAVQDQHLGEIDDSLSRLGEMARNIDTELTEQARMLEDAEDEMDEVQGKMDSNLAGIHKLLKTKNNCQLATIAVLVLVLAGLFVAVLSGV